MYRTATLIFNPVAGQCNEEQDLETIKRILSPEMNLDVQKTRPDRGATEIAREAVEKGSQCIIALGGDGTVSAVAGVLVNTQIPLGIIPRGTANALAGAIGIPNNVEQACRVIVDQNIRTIDTARCNGRIMVLLAGIGFEAETIENTQTEQKQRWGMLAYVLSGIQQLQEFEQFEGEITTEDKTIAISNVAAMTIANIAPPTSILAHGPAELLPHDGLLDITILTPISITDAVTASYHLLQTALQNEATQREDILYLRAKKVKITTNPPQKIVLDGEMIGETPFEGECIPKSLILYVPDSHDENEYSSENREGVSGEIEPEKQTIQYPTPV